MFGQDPITERYKTKLGSVLTDIWDNTTFTQYRDLTIGQLITHTSGLAGVPRQRRRERLAELHGRRSDQGEAARPPPRLRQVRGQRPALLLAAGKQCGIWRRRHHRRDDGGKKTGQICEDLVRDHYFAPLGMTKFGLRRAARRLAARLGCDRAKTLSQIPRRRGRVQLPLPRSGGLLSLQRRRPRQIHRRASAREPQGDQQAGPPQHADDPRRPGQHLRPRRMEREQTTGSVVTGIAHNGDTGLGRADVRINLEDKYGIGASGHHRQQPRRLHGRQDGSARCRACATIGTRCSATRTSRSSAPMRAAGGRCTRGQHLRLRPHA